MPGPVRPGSLAARPAGRLARARKILGKDLFGSHVIKGENQKKITVY